MKNKDFKEYQTSKNKDGSINILKVPIFKLGKHKGVEFDEDLVQEIIKNHQDLKREDYYPSVIIGHNEDFEMEKEAEGFMDNLQTDNETIYADLIKIDAQTFEDKLKKRKYPHRSVEFNPVKKIFSALALLGGTSPHHKLPIMEFTNDKIHQRYEVEFEDDAPNHGVPNLEEAIEIEKKMRNIRDIWWKAMDFIDKILFDKEKTDKDKKTEVKSLLEQGNELLGKEITNFKEDKTMPITFTEEQITAFKEKYHLTPEEAVTKLQTFEANEKKRLINEKTGRIKVFCDSLKKDKHIAPVVVDEFIQPFMESINGAAVKFKEGEKPGLEAFEDTINKILELAGEDKLVVPFDEKTEQGRGEDGPRTAFDDNENVNPESLKLHKKVLQFMEKDPTLTYEKALYKASDL